MSGSRKTLVFTLTAGRTGTQYLADLLRANLLDVQVRHEVIDYDAFGIETPELSHLLQFNSKGNTAYVQAFWQRKLQRALAAPGSVYAETSHLLMKAGLVENLEPVAAQADIRLIVLQRDWSRAIRSYIERHPVLDLASRWLWYLDPQYPSNLVPPGEFLRDAQFGYWIWYLCEVFTRAEYYRLQMIGNPEVSVVETSLERIATRDGAAELLAALGLPAATDLVIPAAANENPQGLRLADEALAQIESRLAALSFDPKAQAARVLAQRRPAPGRPSSPR